MLHFVFKNMTPMTQSKNTSVRRGLHIGLFVILFYLLRLAQVRHYVEVLRGTFAFNPIKESCKHFKSRKYTRCLLINIQDIVLPFHEENC